MKKLVIILFLHELTYLFTVIDTLNIFMVEINIFQLMQFSKI